MEYPNRVRLKILFLLPFSAVLLIWLLLIFAEVFFPLLPFHIHPRIAEPLFNSVCHQLDEKSVTFGKYASFVCSRCVGIYSGILVGSVLYILLNIRFDRHLPIIKKIFIAASLLLVADVFADDIGMYAYSHFFSFATGILWGQLAQIVIFAGI